LRSGLIISKADAIWSCIKHRERDLIDCEAIERIALGFRLRFKSNVADLWQRFWMHNDGLLNLVPH